MEKQKIVRITLWSLVSVAAAYGAYRLVKHIVKKSRKEIETGKAEYATIAAADAKAKDPKDKFNSQKVLSKGMKDSLEVKTAQLALNGIITDMIKQKDYKKYCSLPDPQGQVSKCIEEKKKTYFNPNWITEDNMFISAAKSQDIIDCQNKYYPAAKEAADQCANLVKRRDKVASLTLLDADGNFGQKTADVAKVILGIEQFTYADVKQKRIAFSQVYKYPNPYTK